MPAVAASPAAAPAQRFERTPDHPTLEPIEAQLHYQTGKITVRGGLATLVGVSAYLRKLFRREPADVVAKP